MWDGVMWIETLKEVAVVRHFVQKSLYVYIVIRRYDNQIKAHMLTVKCEKVNPETAIFPTANRALRKESTW